MKVHPALPLTQTHTLTHTLWTYERIQWDILRSRRYLVFIPRTTIISSFFCWLLKSILDSKIGWLSGIKFQSVVSKMLSNVDLSMLVISFWLLTLSTQFLFIQGTLTASSYDVMVKWAPPNEFARLSTIAYMGYVLGAAVCYPLAGLINHLFNWECVFYFTGKFLQL